MKKKLLLLVVMLSVLLFVLAISASAVEIDGVHYSLDSKNQTAQVTKDNRTAQTEIVTIPSVVTYEGVDYMVTKIQDNAFDSNKTVKEIRILSEYITAIPYGMIANTYDGALEKIYIDFSNITSYSSAALNPSNQTNGNDPKANKFYYYDAKAFVEKGEDVLVTEPDFSNVTSFGAAAFQGANFKKIVLPDTIKDLNNQIFRKSTIEELVIEGNTLETISYYVFQSCTQLKKITIESNNLRSISNDVFAGCTAVEEIYIDMSSCEEVRSSAFMFASRYDAGQKRVQWYNLDGEKVVDLSSMQKFYDRCFASSNLGSATIVWPTAISVLEDQSFRLCNINQTMVINAAEGVTLELKFWAFNGNNPTVLICNEGVTSTAARFTGTTAVFMAPSVKIADSGRGFNGASTLYTFGLTEGSYVPKENECTVVNISSGEVNYYGACGVIANVLTADGENVTIGKVSHTTVDAIDDALCPVGKVNVTSCKFCDYKYYTVDGEAVEAKEHSYVLVGSIVYGDYFQMGTKTNKCECGAEIEQDTPTEQAIFVWKGYSASTYGDTCAITQGFYVNREALAAYKACTADFDFGLFVTVNKTGEAYSPSLDSLDVITINFDNSANNFIDVKVTGIPNDKGEALIVMCAYVTDGGNIYYLDGGVTSQSVVGVSYNSIINQ